MSSKVAETIKQDLKQQLLAANELPFKLTLASIADYYAISLTPVREVIDDLIIENIIIKQNNGRLSINPITENKELSSTPKIGKNSINLNSDLDELVTHYIIQLSLGNFQEYLREEATAVKFNTGRTVIRQVFSRLAGAGFLQHVPRCGWKVRVIREKDMADYLEIREILEVKALTLARPLFVKSELEAFLKVNIANENPAFSEFDNNLHNYWISRCDNWYIQDFFNRQGSFYSTVFEFASLGDHVISEMAQEHRDILDNLIKENWIGAEAALVKHIRDQKENVAGLILRNKR